MNFTATVHLSGKTATGIRVPDEVVEALGSGKRPAVVVTVGNHSYRTTVAPMGGEYWVPLSAENREKAAVSAGDEVSVEITLDTQPRELEVPEDFADALAASPAAKSFFDGLSYSNRRWHVLNIDGAKTAETRQRRIEKSIAMLAEGRAR
jgi:hypothetical protein